jgi:hypothetical protein
MQPTTLSKSRFKIALECPRKLVYVNDEHNRYVNTKNSDDLLKSLAEGGHQVGALAKLMYPGGIEITAKSIDDQIRETEQLLEQEEITLFEPTFRHGNLVVRVDVLVKRGADIKLIEVKAKGFDPVKKPFRDNRNHIVPAWRPYLYDVAFQALVLERSHPGWNVTPYLMLLDTRARASEDGIGAQFQVIHAGRRSEVTVRPGFDPATLNPPLLRTHDVTEEVRLLRANPVETPAGTQEFDTLIEWLAEHLATGQDLPVYLGSQCKRCEFYCTPDLITDANRSGWAECMESALNRPIALSRTDTIFGLCGHRNTDELLGRNRLALSEVDIDDLNVREVPNAISPSQRHAFQVEEARGDVESIHLERNVLRDALAQWTFPLHFIDFETSRPALPFHQGRTPNDLLLFQFSHHSLSADGRLRHASECLIAEPGVEPSIAVVRALRNSLSGDAGTVVHWWDHEKTVLKAIQKRIEASEESDREDLIAFIDTLVGDAAGQGRLADLGRLVEKTAFFQGTNGRSSIKKVLPAVLSLSNLLKERYSQPIYGTELMPSLNFPAGWIWLREKDGQVRDPYELLEPTWLDNAVLKALEQGDEEDSGCNNFVANGGAAMVAYAKLQRPDLSGDERRLIEDQLKRYCELDTLAMVMVYEAVGQWLALR